MTKKPTNQHLTSGERMSIQFAPSTSAVVLHTDWRSTLTPDDANTVVEARRYAERWQGMTNNSPLILIDKLVRLLDKE